MIKAFKEFIAELREVAAGPAEGLWGYLVEFENVDQILAAAREVRDEGYTHWDTHTPFPVHGLDGAMGIRRTSLPLFVFGGGLTGCALALLMQWWMNAINYPFVVSGKPFFSLPANIPIIFELTVLFSAFGAFFGMLMYNRLPEYYHPLFNSERFSRMTTDRFFLSVEAKDPKFDREKTRAFLETLGGVAVEEVEGT